MQGQRGVSQTIESKLHFVFLECGMFCHHISCSQLHGTNSHASMQTCERQIFHVSFLISSSFIKSLHGAPPLSQGTFTIMRFSLAFISSSCSALGDEPFHDLSSLLEDGSFMLVESSS